MQNVGMGCQQNPERMINSRVELVGRLRVHLEETSLLREILFAYNLQSQLTESVEI